MRISLEDKAKVIEDSKRSGFNRKKIEEKYGIGRNTISNILKNQTIILKDLDSEAFNTKNSKSVRNHKVQIKTNTNLLNLRGFNDILPIILQYLDNKDLRQFRLTCKQLAEMIREKNIWRIRIVSHIKRSQNRISDLISVCYFNLNANPSWMLTDGELNGNSLESLEEFVTRFGKGWWPRALLAINKSWKKTMNAMIPRDVTTRFSWVRPRLYGGRNLPSLIWIELTKLTYLKI